MKFDRAKTGLLLFVLFAGMGIGLATAQVTGDYGTPPRLVPYTGFLENSGVPVTGSVDLSFFVTDDVSTPSSGALWQEDHTGVVVAAGKFGVMLGQSTGFGTLLTDRGELYVGITIGGVDLAGRQRLAAAPYAISVSEADDFTVRGALAAEAGLSVTGNASISGDATVSGDFTQEVRADNGVRVRKVGNISRIAFDAQANDPGEIVHYEDSNTGELWLSSSDDWDANTANDRVIFGEYSSRTESFSVAANGNATVRGDLVVNGNTWAGSDWNDQVTKSAADGNTVSGTGIPNNGWAVQQCSNGQYMCGIAFTHPTGQNSTFQERVVIRCCSL